ncbi:MAG: MetS family NSS transporter small subunit [Candidatus Aminicenantes bacterium]|nr:MetS family NSS transporter small subunit [Candidatus Aminicenantes bacterium]MBL7082932.1 MetS family NSS transporter small subunit [Candidatus Aminicenantes bacterium]NQT79998.1 MetS family NSS transporter small subunit [Candidatus Aminicenantes bacterium]
MRLEAILFMIFIFAVCLGGFAYSLYLSYKKR